MPIFFKTTVKEGSVAGKGVFALQDIPKGAIWWRAWSDEPQFTKDPNCAFNEHTVKDFIATHSHQEIVEMIHSSQYFKQGDVLIYNKDDRKCTNHSFEPNSQTIFNKEGDWKKLKSIALRDIKAGEEILENYCNSVKGDGNWVEEVVLKYDGDRVQLERDLGIKEYPQRMFED